MIKVEKRKIGKKSLAIIITASVLALLIAAYVIMSAVISSQSPGSGSGSAGSGIPEIKDGEAIYNNTAVVYPYISKSKIISVAVSSHKDAFVMSRPEGEEQGSYENYFMFFYQDTNGDLAAYYPDIMMEEADTSYTDFYSVEASDGLNMYKIDYLLAAIGALYFDQRIEPEEDRAAQLNRYGLGTDQRETVYISYLDDDGNTCEQKIFIGDKRITGVGYYFMLEGRDYIYTSAASDRFDYLLDDFESFLHSRLIPEGLAADGIYEPYLTTDYKQWTNKYYGINSGGLGMTVAPGSQVVVKADVLDTVYIDDGNSDYYADGYRRAGYSTISVDLNYITSRPEFNRLIAAIESSKVGNYADNEIVASIITDVNEAEIGKKYTYEIYGLEAVLADDGEHEEKGYAVGDNDLVKVIYNYRIDGITANVEPAHAVIDLSADSVIPEDIRAALRGACVGDDLTGSNLLSFDVVYSEENAHKRSVQLIVTDIRLITKIDEYGSISYLDEITEDCIVTYDYKYLVDGYEVGEEGSATVDLSSITEGEDLEIKNSLIGMNVSSNLDKCVLTETVYCQPFMDFLTYRISSVEGFVQKEMVVSFEFVNASQRDPFYGESIYANTLENENKYYALDAIACQNATFLLGGIGASSSGQVSAGLTGSETVAIGLTPENLSKYGLYDGYTIYFELPRGITAVSGSGDDELDDYTYLDTLGCYLYISKLQSDGTRYIGSSLYGIIVKIEGTQFNYLEKSFREYWARTNLVMMDYSNIDKVTLELDMSDVYGSYEFDLDHKTIYIVGNEHYDEKPESGGTEYNFLTVTARPLSERLSDTVFSAILAQEGRDSMNLANLYNRVAGEMFSIGHDTAGASYFKEMLRMLYSTNYSGVLTEEETEAAFDSAPKIMSISFRLSNSPYSYTYDFYRVSDRRVMVHVYRVDPSGNPVDGSADESSGFYISTFAAKKIINGFVNLLNGEELNVDEAYWS